MPAAFPPFLDLLELAQELKRTRKQEKLSGMLLQAWRAEACLGDLLQADDCCKILRQKVEMDQVAQSPQEQTVAKALQTSAVSLYVRATSTGGKSGERGAIQLPKRRLTTQQIEDHEALIALRNNAMAHVNPKHKAGDRVWHKIVLFAVPNEQGRWIPAASTNETTFHLQTLARLERMLPTAIEIVGESFTARLRAVSAGLNEVKIGRKAIQKHLFDPVEVFGSEAAVSRILSSRGKASDRFWVSD